MNELKLLELFKDEEIFSTSKIPFGGSLYQVTDNFVFLFEYDRISSFTVDDLGIIANSTRGGGYRLGTCEGELRMVTQTTLVEV